MLELQNITKTYNGITVIENLDLTVDNNELTVLLGASGCGKSTLLKIISGIVSPDSGTVFLDGENILDRPIHKRDTVVMFQEHQLFPHMNVFDNVAFALKIRKTKKAVIEQRVHELLKMVKLEDYAKKFPAEISGGQKQRVAIIRALAVLPKILLLDEPFANLDIQLRKEMQALLKEIQRSTKVTSLMVTHDKDEAFFLADRLAVMMDKTIKQIDTPEKIYTDPTNVQIANFFGNTSYIQGKIKNGFFSSGIFDFKLAEEHPDSDIIFLLLRHENIVFDNGGTPFTITKKEFYGDRTVYELIHAHTRIQSCRLENTYHCGDIVRVSLKNTRPIFFKEKL